jgi:hypothetical protein
MMTMPGEYHTWEGKEMETILGGLAFACVIAAQFFAVVACARPGAMLG